MEASGLIDELTDVILDKSVAACAQWRKLGFDYGVSINVSVLTLSQPDCAQRVLRIVKEHGVDPGCVTIEMTESSADATELKTVLGNLSRLRIHGFGLSIDDYGTGYSSMDRLARIAFTELKIDQSFVAEASTNPSAMAIIRSSVGMANVLQLVSVAEGVETKEHWELVRGIGCELAQGYYISPPVEARAVPRMALEWLKRVQAGEISTTMDISPGR
jgi:EAL domain-containing protein (putative c-di-GMP-specific phosphodiesterase class I)